MQNSITQGFCVRIHEHLLRYSGCQCRVLSRWARHEHFTRFPSQEVTLHLRVSLSSPRLSVTQAHCAVASLLPASMACFTRFLRPPPPPLPDGGLSLRHRRAAGRWCDAPASSLFCSWHRFNVACGLRASRLTCDVLRDADLPHVGGCSAGSTSHNSTSRRST